jgi:hypothetical protein
VRNPTPRPIRVTVEPSVRDRAWWFEPDHLHATLQGGTEQEFRFRWWREPKDRLDTLRIPVLALDVEFLAKTTRVTMPSREFPLAVALPDDAFDASKEAALALDGRSAPLRLPSAAIEIPDGALTVEAWVLPRTHVGRRGVVSKAEGSEFGLLLNDGIPAFHVFAGDAYGSAVAKDPLPKDGAWHHLAGVFDGKEVRLYVDGRRVAARSAQGNRRRNGWPLFIGADPGAEGKAMSFFHGLLDEVRLSNVARYSGDSFQPRRRFTPDADTLLLLHLDRALGSVVPDHSPHHRHPRTEVSDTILLTEWKK